MPKYNHAIPPFSLLWFKNLKKFSGSSPYSAGFVRRNFLESVLPVSGFPQNPRAHCPRNSRSSRRLILKTIFSTAHGKLKRDVARAAHARSKSSLAPRSRGIYKRVPYKRREKERETDSKEVFYARAVCTCVYIYI